MKRKILFVINSLELGGAERSLSSLLNTFDYAKYDVDLLMFRTEGIFLKLIPTDVHILPKIEFYGLSLPKDSFKRRIKSFWYRLMGSVGLRINRLTRKYNVAQVYWKYTHRGYDTLIENYDAAIAWGQGNPTHFVAEKTKAKKKIAVVNTNYKAAGYNRDFDYPYYDTYDYILTVSDKLGMLLKNVFPEFEGKIRTLYDINNAELIWKQAEQENPFKSEESAEKRALRIVTVANLSLPTKGHDLAVNAARIMLNRGMSFQWYFVGDGHDRAVIERDIAEYGLEKHVILTGAKDNPCVYMKNADIYVQTSRFEGYCLALCEARILEKPIVTTDFDVVGDQIVNEQNGLIVSMTGQAIADGIRRLVDDEALRSRLIENLKHEKKGNTEEIEKLYALLED